LYPEIKNVDDIKLRIKKNRIMNLTPDKYQELKLELINEYYNKSFCKCCGKNKITTYNSKIISIKTSKDKKKNLFLVCSECFELMRNINFYDCFLRFYKKYTVDESTKLSIWPDVTDESSPNANFEAFKNYFFGETKTETKIEIIRYTLMGDVFCIVTVGILYGMCGYLIHSIIKSKNENF
jgi:hypothetical protein